MTDPAPLVAALLTATQRARPMRARRLVVKLGGSALDDPAAEAATLDAVAALWTLGVPLALVHGGGKPIDRAMDAAGLTPVKIQGRRYTDDATLEIVVRVLSQINADLVWELEKRGCPAVGFTDLASFPLSGERLMLPGLDLAPVDLGRVGAVHHAELEALTGSLVVLPSLARDRHDGLWLNVNADTVTAALAKHFRAETVLFLTDTPGVLADAANPSSRIERLTRADCARLVQQGVIGGGMIPKVEACFECLDAGATRAAVLDGREPGALLAGVLGLPPYGTEIVDG